MASLMRRGRCQVVANCSWLDWAFEGVLGFHESEYVSTRSRRTSVAPYAKPIDP